jgi:site-specific DNA-methyltransferase (adenine-specific)
MKGMSFPIRQQMNKHDWQFCEVERGLHPTQKPVKLCEYFIKTYTNENELILDNCFGSGSTFIACINTNRNFIGFELNQKYYNIAKNRINQHIIDNNLQDKYKLIA